ncbi:MAG: RnfH family protein [Gammaproteobacteria bacterium]|nr:RnfH family protein [Gammaproteobacteria bacterium]
MSSTTGEKFKVQVVYARPDIQRVIAIEVPRGATLRNAVERSRIADHFPDLDLAVCELGIFGEMRDPGDLVAPGDRIEIYRPLEDDPKAIRRRRAREQRRGKR